jgi:succinyl-CoA synthetase beta subunit
MFCGNLVADKMALCVKEVYEKELTQKPIVIRLKGLNSPEANEIVHSIKKDQVYVIDDFEESIAKVQQLVKAVNPKN